MFDLRSSSITAFVALLIAFVTASSQDVPGIIYLDRPKNNEAEQYLLSWPALQECISRLQAQDSLGAEKWTDHARVMRHARPRLKERR